MVPVDTTFSKLEATIALFHGQRWAQCKFSGTQSRMHHEVDFVRIVLRHQAAHQLTLRRSALSILMALAAFLRHGYMLNAMVC